MKISSYSAKDIAVLEGLEPVRKRPGMFIGGTGADGLHHLVWEIFDNARDEAMGGFCNTIEIALLPVNPASPAGGRVRVADNGRGIPVDIHKQTKKSALETVMTTLHAGGKFGQSGYKISGGLHGVGASVVNALSSYCRAEVHRDGARYTQEYSRGEKKSAVKKIGPSKKTGTIITFEPDQQIFSAQGAAPAWSVGRPAGGQREMPKFDWPTIVSHFREQAYLVRGLRISIIDARGYEGKLAADEVFFLSELGLEVPSTTFYFEGGLASLVRYYNETLKPLQKEIFYVSSESEKIQVEIALQYVDDISARIQTFANDTRNPEGGTHLTGFKAALTRVINNYAKKNDMVKETEGGFTGEDVLEGLTAVISVKLANPQFEGQTKAKLGNPEARTAVEAVFGEAFSAFLEEKPDEAKVIISKAMLALRARKAAKAAKDSVLRKGALEGLALPGKLADCQAKEASESELFIVEGDSAGGSAKQGRDRRIQAVLPLRGKILNVERARIDKMLASKEVKALVIALGTSIGDTFELAKIRYHKIVLATDADVDGAHIRTLLLTLFYRYFRNIIEAGYLYIAQPPLYKIKKGKEISYAYSDAEKEKLIGKDEADIQRYKGLGEMNPEELWETTMDPARRLLKRVTIEDAQEADRVFDTLMGADVLPRKSFIQTHAKLANLDI